MNQITSILKLFNITLYDQDIDFSLMVTFFLSMFKGAL